MLRKKPIKRKVVKRENPHPLELELKNYIGDKVSITYNYGIFNGVLNKNKNSFTVSAGRPGYPEGAGFISFVDSDIKRIFNDDFRIEIVLK